MVRQVSNQKKQEIRDKIDRLKHKREPWVLSIRISLPVFIAILLFMAGYVQNQTDDMFDTHYNVSFTTINQSNNVSILDSARVNPVKILNPQKVANTLDYIWITFILAYALLGFTYFYFAVYVRYDKKINELYDELLGMPKKEGDISKSLLKQRFKDKILHLISGLFVSKKEINNRVQFILLTFASEAFLIVGGVIIAVNINEALSVWGWVCFCNYCGSVSITFIFAF